MNDLITTPQATPALGNAPRVVDLSTDEIAGIKEAFDDSAAKSTRALYAKSFGYFQEWATSKGGDALPAAPETVAAYYRYLATAGKSVSTIRTYRAAIGSAHRDKGLPDPTANEVCRKVLSGIGKKAKSATRGDQQKQARGATGDDVQTILDTLGDTLPELRAKAMLCVARSGLTRRSELVALTFSDFDREECLVSVYREKTGNTTEAALTPAACETLNVWIDALEGQGIASGPLFRRIDRHGNVLDGLNPASVNGIFKTAYEAAGLDPKGISGHSARVGTVQDLTAKGADVAAIANAGGWKDAVMPIRYGERMAAKRGAVARLLHV